MVLLFDIGNTSTVLGFMRDDNLAFTERIPTAGADKHELIRAVLHAHDIRPEKVRSAVLSSVVPRAAEEIRNALLKMQIRDIMQLSCHTDTGLGYRVDRPETIGVDMIAGACAAVNRFGAPVIVIDMGTATTFAAVDEEKNYLGHVIIPGVHVALSALTERTAQLPQIELTVPPGVIGKNTQDAMKSGSLYGAAAMIDGMLDRIAEECGWQLACGQDTHEQDVCKQFARELGVCEQDTHEQDVREQDMGGQDARAQEQDWKKIVTVVATGGLAGIVTPLCRHEIILDDVLVLEGMYDAWLRSRGKDE